MRGRLLILLALCASTLACVSDPPVPGERHEQLVVLLDDAVRDLDPRFTVDATSMRVSGLLFDSLVSVDNERAEPTLGLAESITPDPASLDARGRPRRYLVRLRPGRRWHDGQEIRARDVVHTYRSVLDPALGSPYRGSFARKIADVQPVAGDPYAALFVLHRPYATFLTDLVLGVVPAHVLGSSEGRFDGHYVGSGPFRFHSRLGERRVVLEANAEYAGGAPSVRYLVFRSVADESTRLLSLAGGSADLVQNGLSPILLDVVAEQPGLVVDSGPSLSWTYLAFNLRDPLLGEPRVRRALALAIDREQIIERKIGGRAELSVGMMAPVSWAHAGELRPLAPDPAAAEALLDEAGHPRDATGRRFTLSLKISSDRFRRSLGRLIVDQLARIGVAVELRSFETGTFLADVRAGNFQSTLLELPEPSEPDMLRWMFYSRNTPAVMADRRDRIPGIEILLAGDEPGCRDWARGEVFDGALRTTLRLLGRPSATDRANRTWYANPRFDCLVMRGWEELDPARRKPLYDEAQRILAEDLPALPLWHDHHVVVRRQRVEGYQILPNGRFTSLAKVRLTR